MQTTLGGYELPRAVQNVCLSEAVLDDTTNFVPLILEDRHIDTCFVKFTNIAKMKEIYSLERLVGICADLIHSLVSAFIAATLG